MRKTLATALLVLALCSPALAGDIHTPGATQPPPPPHQAAPGNIPSTPAALIDALLSLLALALP